VEDVVFHQWIIFAKRGHLQKWSSPFTSYFINLTLLLVEGGIPFGTIGFFPLVVAGFFTGAILSLVVGFSFSITASTNTLNVWASKRHTNITHYHTFFTYASIISLIIHHHVTSFSLLFTINGSHLYFPNIIYF
jgi:hypothetical protein